jgi:hypothetical protein
MAGVDRVRTIVRPAGALKERDWQEVWDLNRQFFDVERWYAENELFRRQRIAMFRVDGKLVGIAAIDVVPASFRGRRITVVLTTHVLLLEPWRGQNLIQKLGLRTYLRARLRHPFRPIYWFFDSFSYKSYLLLPRNFLTFWPRRSTPTPEAEKALIDQLATEIYGNAWRPELGVVLRSGRKRLRETTAPLTETELADPDIAFSRRPIPAMPTATCWSASARSISPTGRTSAARRSNAGAAAGRIDVHTFSRDSG